MFPWRSTGMPSTLMDHTAQREANNCRGKAILLKTIAGIGRARNKQTEWHQQQLQEPHAPEINLFRQHQQERKSLGIEFSACNTGPKPKK
jgi:ABC-type transport system involved in cytochrome c biogenesis ATPase subunit